MFIDSSTESISSRDSICYKEELPYFDELPEDSIGFSDKEELSIEIVSQSFKDETNYTLSFRTKHTNLLKSVLPSFNRLRFN